MKKLITIILLITWLLIIFFFSNQNANISEKLSDKTTTKIVEVTQIITKKEYKKQDLQNIIKKYRFLIRKTAHFTLYFILGIIIYLLLLNFEIKNRFALALIICVFYAASDEIHQLFVLDRTFKVFDILIDSLGSFISIFICDYISLKRIKKTNI